MIGMSRREVSIVLSLFTLLNSRLGRRKVAFVVVTMGRWDGSCDAGDSESDEQQAAISSHGELAATLEWIGW